MRYQLPFDAKVLAIFVAVVETRSMSGAARRLGMTQSAISQAVKLLERDLDVVLIDRGIRPLQSTVMGNEVYKSATRWLSEMTALRNLLRVSSAKQLSLLRLGMVDSFATTVGPSLIQEISPCAVKLCVTSGVSPALWEGIKQRELDLVITTAPPEPLPGIVQLPLLKEAYLLALPRNIDQYPVELQALSESLPFIRYSGRTPSGKEVESYLNLLRLRPEPGLEFDTADGVLSMVAANLGWTITTPLFLLQARAALHRIRCVEMPGPQVERRLVLMTRTGEQDRLAEKIAQISRTILQRQCFEEIRTGLGWLSEKHFSCPHPRK
jgi:DNA-binding transcriptional LysR family regulator